MRGKRHYADIMRPTDATGSRGEREGQDAVVIKNWPYSINVLTGGIADEVHGNFGHKSGQLEGFADPSRQVTPGMYLTGGSLGARRLTILFVQDKDERGVEWRMTYEEADGSG